VGVLQGHRVDQAADGRDLDVVAAFLPVTTEAELGKVLKTLVEAFYE
jgi:hypothetical protein